MTDNQTKINAAFEDFLESYLSSESQKQIADTYGAEIAAEVKAIYDDALNAPVDWRTATMDSALDAMHELLTRKYPWLSPKSRTKLNYAFIMAWK